MDSLSRLNLIVHKIKENEFWDNDVKVNMIASEIKYWCEEYLRLYQNIEQTSISKEHAVERRKSLANNALK